MRFAVARLLAVAISVLSMLRARACCLKVQFCNFIRVRLMLIAFACSASPKMSEGNYANPVRLFNKWDSTEVVVG